jgi:hypothetical protein
MRSFTFSLVMVWGLIFVFQAAGAGEANNEEGKVGEYTLPDVLVMLEGGRVRDAEAWRGQRRGEVLELFREHVYGRAPIGRPGEMTFKVFDLEREALGGKAIRKQVTVYFTGKQDGPSMDILIYLPKNISGAAPIFLGMNFNGNYSIHGDAGIRLTRKWAYKVEATEETRGMNSSRWPVEKILARGYGLATVHNSDVDPDFHDEFKNGVQGIFDKYFTDGKRPDDAWGTIGAWAWGLSRAMDYFEADKDINHKRVALLGHSRLGKTALWAGARDERFAIVISNNSGCGGAALSRRGVGETVERINTSFPHWFCENFKRYNGKEDDLPVDQHMLIALVAPRPVYVASAEKDLWADPKGEFLSALHAHPVYKLLGTEGLPVDKMPGVNQPVQGTIGYHIRSGKHDVTDYDWERYLDFADKHFKKSKGL